MNPSHEIQQSVPVNLESRSYRIEIGHGILASAGRIIRSWNAFADHTQLRALIVADRVVASTHLQTLQESLSTAACSMNTHLVDSGETSKCWTQVQAICDSLVEMAADRRTLVIALGGGVIGDLAGFAAAIYARGLRLIQIPTTLLSMVDSSVGGKTGINHPQGKNLIGAFHQPAGVLIDQAVLQTLPDREYRAGLAEVVKYGVILDAEFFTQLEAAPQLLLQRDPNLLATVIARSCSLKAQVVQEDERETTGLRAILNYGHTFGHAFEALAGYGQLLHGEAVSIGMICASLLAEQLQRITAHDTARQRELLQALSLPTSVPDSLRNQPQAILDCMLLDKKTENRELRFVLPSRIGHPEVVTGISAEQALQILALP